MGRSDDSAERARLSASFGTGVGRKVGDEAAAVCESADDGAPLGAQVK